jgi:hypothetical protein
MFSPDKQKQLLDLITPISKAKFGNGFIEIAYSESNKALADLLNINNEKIVDHLRLSPSADQIVAFRNLEDFKKFTDLNNYKSLLVLNDPKILSFVDGNTFVDFEANNELFLFTNAKCYLEFIHYLKSLVASDDREFHFIDSFNFDFRRITMINFSEKGRLNISYPQNIPDFSISKDFRVGYNAFKNCFLPENKSLPKFLKSEIIKIGQNLEESLRLKIIFESLNSIVEKANINFEVFLNEVSVEKLKKDYDELKTKYFKELSDTLGKITQKIVALPIGVSASLIAIDRVSDSPHFLILLLTVIFSTSIILSILVNSNLQDLNYLEKIFTLDYKFLAENKFFSKYPKELELFSEIKQSFLDKISFYFRLSHVLFFAMNIANIFLILFIFQALKANGSAIFLLVLICVGLMMWYWVQKMQRKLK